MRPAERIVSERLSTRRIGLGPVESARRSTRRTAAIAYAIVFVAFVDTFAMLPTVGPYASALGAGALGVGIAVGAYSASNLVFNVVGGVMLDRVGRRRLLLVGLLAAGASMGGYALASGTTSFVVARLVHGAAGGVLLPAVFTVIGDMAPSGSRGRTMGRAGAMIGAAAVVAPGLAGALRQTAGFDAVFAVVAVCMAVGGLLVLGVPETRPGARAGRRQGSWSGLLRRPQLQAGFAGTFGFTFSIGTLAAFLPLHVEDLGLDAGVSGGLFTGFAIVAAAVMLSRLARTVDERGVVIPVVAGLVVIAVALGVLGTAPPIVPTILASLVFGLGYGLVFPATAGIVSAASEDDERGRAYGLYNIFFSLGLATGPAVGGLLASAGFPAFAPAVLVCLVVAALLLRAAPRLA